jgi:predicted PurR-regulated permease PerM
MTETQQPTAERPDVAAVIEIVVRLAVLFLLAAWCFRIIAPFVGPVAWGIIIAVAAAGPFHHLERLVGGRSRLAGTLFILIALLLLIVPALILSETLVSGVQQVAGAMSEGKLDVPPPPDAVAHWPIVGDAIYPIWDLASNNLRLALEKFQPQLQQLGLVLLAAAGSAGLGIVQFVLAIIIAAVLLASSDTGGRFARTLAKKLAGERGDDLAELASATVASVAAGIVGVAFVQAVLAGFGFIAVGLPAAGLWAMVVLLFAVVQLPVVLVMAPIILYVFSTSSTTVGVLFMVWGGLISVLDNFLKPILFGRGAKVPTLVIFMGAIGGMLTSGIIGLFIGSVILAVGYALFRAWLGADAPEALAAATEDAPPSFREEGAA